MTGRDQAQEQIYDFAIRHLIDELARRAVGERRMPSTIPGTTLELYLSQLGEALRDDSQLLAPFSQELERVRTRTAEAFPRISSEAIQRVVNGLAAIAYGQVGWEDGDGFHTL